MCRADWVTIRCSLRMRSGLLIRLGLGLVVGRRGCGLGWSLGRMLREGERREGMLILRLMFVFGRHEEILTGYT